VCSFLITPTSGRTQLPCGCHFHPRCLHCFYAGYTRCPVCPSGTAGDAYRLDFGDDPIIAQAHRRATFSLTSSKALERPEPFNRARDVVSRGLDKLRGAIENTSRAASSPWMLSLDDVIHRQQPISELCRQGVRARDLVTSGITWVDWVACRYSLDDLMKLNPSMDDLYSIGVPADQISLLPITAYQKMPTEIVEMDRYGVTPAHFGAVRRNVDELLTLGLTTHYFRDDNWSGLNHFSYLGPDGKRRLGLVDPLVAGTVDAGTARDDVSHSST